MSIGIYHESSINIQIATISVWIQLLILNLGLGCTGFKKTKKYNFKSIPILFKYDISLVRVFCQNSPLQYLLN